MNKKRYIAFIVLLTILCTTLMPTLNVFAHNIPRNGYTNNIEDIRGDYPELYDKLKELQKTYPNWNFKIYNTGWNWDKFIDFQEENPSRSLVEAYGGRTRGQSWIDQDYKDRPFDTDMHKKRWLKASRAAIEYFVDPRTYLNSNDIFALYSKAFQDNIPDAQLLKGVKELLKGSRFESEAETVVKICKEQNVDAIDIAARLKQENGPEMNPLNIGMSGNGTSSVIQAGINYARNRGWNNFETGLRGGVQEIVASYIKAGQITKHSQKFNYVSQKGYNQYMQNIEAPMSEGLIQRRAFTKIDPELKKYNYTFVIPIFSKMPQKEVRSPEYIESQKVTKLNPGEKKVEVTESMGIRLRTEPNILNSSIAGRTVKKGTILILEEKITEYQGMNKGFIWYRARMLNGDKYYIAVGPAGTSERWVKVLEEKSKDTKEPGKTIAEPKEIGNKSVKYTERKYHGNVYAKITVDQGSTLNFRNLPDTKMGLILTSCSPGKQIRVISKVTLEKPDGLNWYKVEVDGKESFCARGSESDPFFRFTTSNVIFEDEYKAVPEKPKKPEPKPENKPTPAKPEEPKKPENNIIEPDKNKINKEIPKGKFVKPVKIKVTADLGLNVRNKPGVQNSNIIAQLIPGAEVEIIESVGSADNKDLWFKINDSREKYISKGKIGDESYFDILDKIEFVKEEKPVVTKEPAKEITPVIPKEPEEKPASEKPKDALGNSEVIKKLEYKGEKKLSVIYNAKIEDIKALGDIKVTRKNGQTVNKENLVITDIATGNKIYINGEEYTIIRKGDINGDGLIDEKDALDVFKMRIGNEYSTLQKAAARLSVTEEYQDTINSNINIQNTKEFKILLNKILNNK